MDTGVQNSAFISHSAHQLKELPTEKALNPNYPRHLPLLFWLQKMTFNSKILINICTVSVNVQ